MNAEEGNEALVEKISSYLKDKAENIAKTSLGKDMALVKAAVTQRKFVGTAEAEPKEEKEIKKQWFWKKKK